MKRIIKLHFNSTLMNFFFSWLKLVAIWGWKYGSKDVLVRRSPQFGNVLSFLSEVFAKIYRSDFSLNIIWLSTPVNPVSSSCVFVRPTWKSSWLKIETTSWIEFNLNLPSHELKISNTPMVNNRDNTQRTTIFFSILFTTTRKTQKLHSFFHTNTKFFCFLL